MQHCKVKIVGGIVASSIASTLALALALAPAHGHDPQAMIDDPLEAAAAASR